MNKPDMQYLKRLTESWECPEWLPDLITYLEHLQSLSNKNLKDLLADNEKIFKLNGELREENSKLKEAISQLRGKK